jgi:hypothetical protein
MARFTEEYVLNVVADDGARLFWKGEKDAAFSLLIDKWESAGSHEARVTLTRGAVYEFKLEYRELSGAAKVQLLVWPERYGVQRPVLGVSDKGGKRNR